MKNQNKVLLRQIVPEGKPEPMGAWLNQMVVHDFQHTVTVDANGRVNAIFHRNLKTAEAKL